MSCSCWLLSIGILAAACGGDSDDTPEAEPWTVVTEEQPAALLSVWASGANDVYTVGGDPRNDTGPLVFHYDGTAWTKLDALERNVDLWAIYGFANGPIFMGGANGTILKYENGTFTKQVTPGNLIVFGIWGASPSDVWAVGGSFGGGHIIWHYDGTTWSDVDAGLSSEDTVWKLNGRATDDVWMTGTTGIALHWTGAAFTREDLPVDASLFAVAASEDRFITVGGAFDGVLFENAGDGWKSAIPTGGALLNGVAASGDVAFAVGEFGTVLRRGSSGWATDERVTDQHMHAAFIDPDGGAWAAGGDFDSTPTKSGVLIHNGEPLQGTIP
ncbi:MAG: hypothetical protein ABI867_05255 [Kofleriaceae bacterium]